MAGPRVVSSERLGLPTRVGLVGAGSVAARHALSLANLPEAQLVAVTDHDAQRASTLAGEHQAGAYDDLPAMLDAAELDAVYICVPPFAHGRPELTVIEAELPFFVEKPLSVDLGTAEQIAAAVEAAGLVTATGYHWRYLDTVATAQDLLRATPARLAVASWLDKVPPPSWWTAAAGSGGQIIEQATHLVDLLRLLMGEVSEVWSAGARSGTGEIDTVTAATLRFASGAVASLSATCLLTHKVAAGVGLYADGLAVQLSETELTVQRGDDAAETRPARVDAKALADLAFIDSVRGVAGVDIAVPYAEALRTHRVACALATSARTGEVVRLAAAPVSA